MGAVTAEDFDYLVQEAGQLPPEEPGRAMRKHFYFHDDWININHGSFGSYPRAVGRALQAFQAASEQRPDEFARSTYPALLLRSRAALAALLNVPVPELVFVANATTGVNTVLRALVFRPGDRIVHFDFLYAACRNTVAYVCETTPAVAVAVDVALPASDDALVAAFRAAVVGEGAAAAARIAIFDTVVSMPGVRLPFERLVAVCRELGVLSLVDGAHGVGHVALDLGALDADFFVTNCHKWLFVPRGCAAFHVPQRNHALIRSTLPTSHGYQPPGAPTAPADFAAMFAFVGTADNSPALCVPAALRFRASVCGGEARIMAYSQQLGRAGAALIAARLGTEVMAGGAECCMWNVRLPVDVPAEAEAEAEAARVCEWAMGRVSSELGTAVPMAVWRGVWWARVCGQVYLEMADFEAVAGVLERVCAWVRAGEHRQGGAA